jgi:tRNA A37 threonylcarbamoyladenosine biosynthesis protein TsaE
VELLFGDLYKLRVEKAAEGGKKVVVVGPPCAGKTTFIKQFLEPKLKEKFGDSSRVKEVTAGLAPGKEKAQMDLRKVIRRIFARRYVSGHEAAEELKDINGAGHLKSFKRLPRDFVEYLKERYYEYSLYLFYISPGAGEDGDVVERLSKIAKRIGVKFEWLGLEYVPPGVAAMLKERGEDYVEEQLRLYREVLNEFGAAGGRLAKLWELGKDAVEKAGERVLEKFAGFAEELAKVLLPLLPGGVVVGAVMGVASYFLSGHRKWRDWIRLLADWSRLDGRLKDLAAAHIALELGVGKEEVRDVLDSLSNNKELEKLEERVEELYDQVEELWDEVIAQTLAKYGDVYTRRRAEGLRVTYHKVVDAGVEYRLVTAGGFAEAAEEVERLLAERGFVVVKGSRGIGKSTLAAYVAYNMLKKGDVDYVVKVKSPVDVSEVDVFKMLGRRALLFFDIYPREVYLEKFDPRRPLKKVYGSVEVLLSLAALAERNREAGAGLYVLAVVHDKALEEAYEGKAVRDWLEGASFYIPRLNTPEFLAGVLKSYACPNENDCCLNKVDTKRLVSLISSHDAYTLVAKYAGLWLRERECDAGDVERAVEEAKREPKLFLARYIRDVLLWRSSEEERVRLMYRVAVPLLLHAVFGPVPEGVTHITQAKDEGVFYQPEEIEKLTKPQWDQLKAGLQPIAKWLAQRHEDLVEETLRDLAGLNGEEARKPYGEALGDLIEALDWTRRVVLEEGGKILAELDVPEWGRGLKTALLAFVNRRLAAVFRGGEGKQCWKRAALIAGHALAGYRVLPRREPEDVAKDADARGAGQRRWERLSEDVEEVLGKALKSCAVDAYLTIEGEIRDLTIEGEIREIPPLSIFVVGFPYNVEALYAGDLSQIRRIRERLGVLSPLADAETIKEVKRTAEELLAKWRIGEIVSSEVFYGLGLAALAAEGEVDRETADLLLRVASNAVRRVTHSAAALPVLVALRPLGEKAPHRYIVALAAASELIAPYQEAALYIYNTLQQLKNRLSESKQIWPLVEAVDIYSNLLRKHLTHIIDRRKDPTYAKKILDQAVVEMCSLYGRVKSDRAVAPNGGFSAQHLLETVARASVLAVALENDGLAPLVQRYCNFGDIEKEAEAVRKTLEEAAAHPDELRKIAESDADFSGWISTRSDKGDAWKAIENLRTWFTGEIASYKLHHALNERGDLDQEKLKQAAKEFEDAADIAFSSGQPVSQGGEKLFKDLEQWINYLFSSYWALRAYILAAKSCEEFLRSTEGIQTTKTTKSFPKLWDEASKNIVPTAEYLETTADIFGGYLVCLAASGKKKEVEELLKEWRWLLYYSPEVSVATRLMLKLFGVGEGAKLDEIVYVFWPRLLQAYHPAIWLLAGHLQKDKALEICKQLSKSEVCVDAVDAAAGSQEATKRFKSFIVKIRPNIVKVMRKAHRLLDRVDGRSLVEVLAPGDSRTRLALMLLAAVEGRAGAVRLHGLLGSVEYRNNVNKPLFRAVYENCGDLDSEGCRMALLKLYYTPVLAALLAAGPPRGGGSQNRFISAPWI